MADNNVVAGDAFVGQQFSIDVPGLGPLVVRVVPPVAGGVSSVTSPNPQNITASPTTGAVVLTTPNVNWTAGPLRGVVNPIAAPADPVALFVIRANEVIASNTPIPPLGFNSFGPNAARARVNLGALPFSAAPFSQRDPNGVVQGNPGDLFIVASVTTDQGLWINTGVADGNTTWTRIVQGNVRSFASPISSLAADVQLLTVGPVVELFARVTAVATSPGRVLLPVSPTVGEAWNVKNASPTAGQVVTVNGGANAIDGVADFTLEVNQAARFVFGGAPQGGWSVY